MARAASLFNQLLQQFPLAEFQRLVNEARAERSAKGISSWSQFVSMLFFQVARADSLREISNGLACCVGKLSHLGMKKAPPKSTLSYANSHRPAEVFQELFYRTLRDFRIRKMLMIRKPFRLKNKLLSFDSTTITVALESFPWAKYRSKKGFVYISEARMQDCRVLREFKRSRVPLLSWIGPSTNTSSTGTGPCRAFTS